MALPWRKRRIMTYWASGCVQKCDLWAWRRNEKKPETFMRQADYLPTHVDVDPWNCARGVASGK